MSKTIKKLTVATAINLIEDNGVLTESKKYSEQDIDINFHKNWINKEWEVLEPKANNYVMLWFWIKKNVNPKNILIKSYSEIEKETGLEMKKIFSFMKTFQEKNGIKKIKYGMYMLNPDISFKGSTEARKKAIDEYNQIK